MTQYKIIIHCDQFNAAMIQDFESRDEALEHYGELIKEPCILRFGEVLVNTRNITFVQAKEITEEPTKEPEIVEVEAE